MCVPSPTRVGLATSAVSCMRAVNVFLLILQDQNIRYFISGPVAEKMKPLSLSRFPDGIFS